MPPSNFGPFDGLCTFEENKHRWRIRLEMSSSVTAKHRPLFESRTFLAAKLIVKIRFLQLGPIEQDLGLIFSSLVL